MGLISRVVKGKKEFNLFENYVQNIFPVKHKASEKLFYIFDLEKYLR